LQLWIRKNETCIVLQSGEKRKSLLPGWKNFSIKDVLEFLTRLTSLSMMRSVHGQREQGSKAVKAGLPRASIRARPGSSRPRRLSVPEMLSHMLHAVGEIASRLFGDLTRPFLCERLVEADTGPAAPAEARYAPLKRLILADDVGRTLFEEFAAHQAGTRGEEETGWVLLGVRREEEAVVLATLPAGAARDAGVGHVQFNSWGQVLGSRIVRQADRRLTIVGVVHTHPGSLRHPSDGDYRGDSIWVGQLRGTEGIFGIGTADNSSDGHGAVVAYQPRPNVQCLGKLRFSWYSLRAGERSYRPLPVEYTLGPDLARPLHAVWSILEAHAERLDRLCRQQAGVGFEVVIGPKGPALAVKVPLAEPGQAIRAVLEEQEVQYFVLRDGQTCPTEPGDERVDRAIYLLLAELAAEV
jgi:proteasome lid subunit RPN8/RPN11